MYELFVEPFTFEFMQRALVVSVFVGVTCAVLSCWLTLLGWSLMGDAVSHAVLPGVVLASMVGAPLAAGAFLSGGLAVALIGGVSRTSRTKEDASIGVVFTGLFALGLVLISVVPSQLDLQHILFGNVLGVSDSDLWSVVGIGSVVTAVLLVLRRSLVLFAFDPVHAHAVGAPVRRLEVLLLGALALTVVIALQAVGIVLVVAMLITPGATGYLLTDRFDVMLGWAVATGVGACVLGTFASYHLDASTGGCIVTTLALLFALAYLFSPRHGVIAGRRRRGAQEAAPAAPAAAVDERVPAAA